MKNHFVLSYSGNKRDEVERIYDRLDLEGIDTIIEPFCGSSALSFYISTRHPQQFKYILNDTDVNLIKLYRILKDEYETNKLEEEVNRIASSPDFNKQTYLELLKTKTLVSWFIGHKIKQIRFGMFRLNYKHKHIDIKNCPIVKFLRTENVEILNEDATRILAAHENNNNELVYLDPPYLSMCNEFYDDKRNLNIYEYIYLKDYKDANIYTTLERHWLVDLIFKKYKELDIYSKQYQVSKNRVSHVLYHLRQD